MPERPMPGTPAMEGAPMQARESTTRQIAAVSPRSRAPKPRSAAHPSGRAHPHTDLTSRDSNMIAADTSANSALSLATQVVEETGSAISDASDVRERSGAPPKPKRLPAVRKPRCGRCDAAPRAREITEEISAMEFHSAPVFTPEPLPDGLHIAPFRSWEGEPVLLVIRGGVARYPVLKIGTLTSGMASNIDPLPYSAESLSGYHRTWERGVYRDPNFVEGGEYVERYFAVDSHGRRIHVALVRAGCNAPGGRESREGAIGACKWALITEDSIIRRRPRRCKLKF